jgi:hypothetical protein
MPLPKPQTPSGQNPLEAGPNVSPTSTETEKSVDSQPLSKQDTSDKNEDKDLVEFLKTLKKEELVLPRSNNLTEVQVKQCLETFSNQQKLNLNQSQTAIAVLLQAGGTAKSCDGNLSVSLFGQTIKLAYLRKALAECKCKGNERKLAKYLATKIAIISKTLEIPGNLAKKITRMHPERPFTIEETVWLSDFQVDNKDCPEILRKFITESFEARKTENKGSKNQNTNPKSKKSK